MFDILSTIRRSFDYTGRARRREYWQYLVASVATFLVLGGLIDSIFGQEVVRSPGIIGTLPILIVITGCIPGTAVTVRRFHDIGRSGKFAALPLLPFLLWMSLLVSGIRGQFLFGMMMLTSLGCLAFVVFSLGRMGQRGSNRYGLDPKGEVVPDGGELADRSSLV